MKYFSIGYKKLFGVFMINSRIIKLLKWSCANKLGMVLLLLFISGCGDKVNLTKLCNDNPEICNEFGQDSWCKTERIEVALNRIKVKNNNLDGDKYSLLVAYEGYIKCMSLASQIQHIKLKEKTTLRKNNLLKAKANLSELSDKNVNSKHPHLLYYYWSRESNELALEEFLQLEGSPELENSTAQYHLATYYIKRDNNKTLGLLYRALELHEPGTVISAEVLQTLVTIFTKKRQYKQAYIWLRTYQLSLDKPDKMIENSLINYQESAKLNADFLNKVASSTLSKIEAGEFTSPNY
ncbi:DUF2989 domain-containing protein [Colwellia psychrerythraea]|uniref:Uncharacterized protein n=1 Tax=Colwellia psychrerythraea TaxID=28229 RepID=A0A099KCB8_COLPS|nr:DUF2989 domain-containing protein [Colwellia psychrerythraea]KGJ87652.1 Protein of unknown function DUF2989 [Colwellia psychrerythraea]